MIHKILNHYKIIGRLGKGGMGEVYVAEDSRLKQLHNAIVTIEFWCLLKERYLLPAEIRLGVQESEKEKTAGAQREP